MLSAANNRTESKQADAALNTNVRSGSECNLTFDANMAQERPVVTDDDGASRESQQRIFQVAKGFDIERKSYLIVATSVF